MKPYYEEAGIKIYHGDCREVLPQLGKFDLLLTDPPYGIDACNMTLGAGRKDFMIAGDDGLRPKPPMYPSYPKYADSLCIWGGNYFPSSPNARITGFLADMVQVETMEYRSLSAI